MTLADKVTALRLILAPLFFIVYLIPGLSPRFLGEDFRWTVPVLWVLFALSEASDLMDGKLARSRREVSDFGKLFDPFSDIMVRITYFLCFTLDGTLSGFPLLVILYREFSIQFLRNLMMKKKVVMAARWGGKIKAVAYMITGAAALLAASAERLGLADPLVRLPRLAARGLFYAAALVAVISFIDYLALYRKTPAPQHGENS
ncbi:MAG: CDP-diacylglycerol--glycerol-3-phosphate 3-phosphatidyltransferase [Spirochaetaceae bacterium]|jgi:CDP-diacylglycerol--glycerol-3-phosphate 3-phosphatidyltransferase|nr:CDP-diacylglycerol--glycerol-3-phosphate 3-phosphatidyltransferase [Spirochaetaceae bacterium]